MKFDATILRIEQAEKTENGEALKLTVICPFYIMKKDIKLEDRKEAQEQIDQYNSLLTRLHLGYVSLLQIVDSSEIPEPNNEKE